MAATKKGKKKQTQSSSPKPKAADRQKAKKPTFEGCEEWSGFEYHKYQQNARAYYAEKFKFSGLISEVWKWMKENEYSDEEIKQAKASNGLSYPSLNVAINCKLLRSGMPDYHENQADYWRNSPGTMSEIRPVSDYINERLKVAIESGKQELEKQKEKQEEEQKKYVPTIQERIEWQAMDACEEVDKWLDQFYEDPKNFDPNGFDVNDHFTQKGINQSHARKILKFYNFWLEEFRKLQQIPNSTQLKKLNDYDADMWRQLKEGYSKYRKTDLKKMLAALEKIESSCNYIISKSAPKKKKNTKPVSTTKQVEKLKYKSSDDSYEISSVDPVNLLEAGEAWIFDTKTRRLTHYVSLKGQTLSVKGTSIINFDEEKTLSKTLKKPQDQLKEFANYGKVKSRKFFDEINTVATKASGRTNNERIILKTYK